jgi:putative membrane protein
VLSSEESKAVAASVARIKSRTGVQVVVAIIRKADTYIELPWKAFALGVSIAALVTVLADVRWPQWVTSDTALIHAAVILATGAACALLAVFVPPFARRFLRETHAHVEVRQHAKALFL